MIQQWHEKVRMDSYYKQFSGKSKKQKHLRIDAVLRDYPLASLRDICWSTHLSQSTVREYKKIKSNDSFYCEVPSSYCWNVFDALKRNPDDIYAAIEETYEWSIKLHIRTTLLAKAIPSVLDRIGNWYKEFGGIQNGL